MPPNTQVREITVKVAGTGAEQIKKLTNEFAGLNKSVSGISKTIDQAKNLFAGFFAASIFGVGIGQITQLADSMQLLRDRIAVLTGSGEGVSKIMDGLVLRANRTKSAITDLATNFARLTASTKETGISTEGLLDLTELLQNTFRLSGASNREAAAASIQLAQGLASGVLRGEEFNSVLEQNTVIGDLLTKQLNTTRGALRAMAKDGQLTASVVLKALFNNMSDVNSKAGQLGQTFEQTVTIVQNKFAVAIDNVNKKFGLSSGFAKGVDFLLERTEAIGIALGLVATTAIPLMITGIVNMTKASIAFAASNPLLLTLSLIGIAFVALFKNMDDFNEKMKKSRASVQGFAADVEESSLGARIAVAKFFGADDFAAKIEARTKGQIESLRSTTKKYEEERVQSFRDAEDAYTKEYIDKKKERDAFLAKLNNGQAGKEDKLKEILSRINKEYLNGKINASEYYDAISQFDIQKLTREFRDGKIDLEKFNAGMLTLERGKINRQFSDGAISLQYFNTLIEQNKVDELNNKLQYGTISLKEYNAELLKVSNSFSPSGAFQVGISSYFDSLGTVGEMTAKAVGTAFGALENEFVSFVTTGEATFERFTSAILEDIARITYQALILRPILQGIMGYFGGATAGTSAGASYTDYSTTAAHGRAFESGGRMTAFATGGVVSKPTMFKYGGGQNGLMGEAGPEAILPLSRGSSGNLGVEASVTPITVNIINNAGADITQEETTGASGEKQLQITINKMVGNAINSGAVDTPMLNSYGVRRRGNR